MVGRNGKVEIPEGLKQAKEAEGTTDSSRCTRLHRERNHQDKQSEKPQPSIQHLHFNANTREFWLTPTIVAKWGGIRNQEGKEVIYRIIGGNFFTYEVDTKSDVRIEKDAGKNAAIATTKVLKAYKNGEQFYTAPENPDDYSVL